MVIHVHEEELWLWLKDCKARKPAGMDERLPKRDKVVRVLQDGSVRGREAREAGDE